MNEELPELSYEEFVRARSLYWQKEAKNAANGMVLPENGGVPAGEDRSSFMLYAP